MFADVGCTPGAPTALDASSAASALALAPAQASAIASAPRDADTGGGAGSGAGGAAASCGAAAFFKLRWSAPATAGEAPPHGYRISRRVVAANTTAGGAMSSSDAGSNGSVRAEAEEDAWLFSHRITRRGALVGIPHAARGAGPGVPATRRPGILAGQCASSRDLDSWKKHPNQIGGTYPPTPSSYPPYS